MTEEPQPQHDPAEPSPAEQHRPPEEQEKLEELQRQQEESTTPLNPQGIEDHPDTNADPDTPKTAAEQLEREGQPKHTDADPTQPDNQPGEPGVGGVGQPAR